MSPDFQHKISNFEIAPPQEIWSKISDQLDDEYNVGDTIISQKMSDYEINPPAFLLENVLSAINTQQVNHSPTKIFAYPVKRLAIAAVTIGLVVLTMIYLLISKSSSTPNNQNVVVIPSPLDTNTVSPSASNKFDMPKPTPPGVAVVTLAASSIKKKILSNYPKSQNVKNIKYASLNPIIGNNVIQPISVTAPPIYDGNGNIIMDENLVSAPDENYIIVTSPNGEQTKISRKFLKMLSVLNGGNNTSNMNAESFQWKMRFEEWRSKLQQASYIPTANNFLDIMDLKEMLQEN